MSLDILHFYLLNLATLVYQDPNVIFQYLKGLETIKTKGFINNSQKNRMSDLHIGTCVQLTIIFSAQIQMWVNR